MLMKLTVVTVVLSVAGDAIGVRNQPKAAVGTTMAPVCQPDR
jgi:hypothetical protein